MKKIIKFIARIRNAGMSRPRSVRQNTTSSAGLKRSKSVLTSPNALLSMRINVALLTRLSVETRKRRRASPRGL